MTNSDEKTVRELLEERIDGEIESVTWYRSGDSARYAFVTSLTEDGRAWLSTILLDVDDETLRVLNNSMWLPADTDVLDEAIKSLARTTSAAAGTLEEDREPRQESLLEFSAEEFGDHKITDDYDPDDADDDWKANEGADEMYRVHQLLEDSPIENADRLIRLNFGSKAPWDGEPQRVMRSPEEIGGNYGVEVSEDDELVIIDVDDVEAANLDALPETLRSESPHGGYHLFVHVPGWRDEFRDRFDVENPHPPWGEVRSQDGYVVGPGSELTECKHDDCCTEDDPGEYELVDAPIATVDATDLSDILAAARGESA